MNNLHDTNLENEINLKETFLILWRGKYFIILCVIIAALCASAFLRNQDNEYTVEYKLKKVSQDNNSADFSNFSGIASLAGIQLPSSSGGDYNLFKELIYSVEVSQKVIEKKHLIKVIFSDEWDDNIGKFTAIKKNILNKAVKQLKSMLTGDEDLEYQPPNSKRLAKFISKNVKMFEDKKTGFLNLSIEHSRPEIALLLITDITNLSDQIIRDRYIKFSKEPLEFYKKKLNISRSREHREALAQLISKEEQKLMLASSSKYFTVEPITAPKISLYPTSPKPFLILAIAILSGFMLGVLIVLLWNKLWKDEF